MAKPLAYDLAQRARFSLLIINTITGNNTLLSTYHVDDIFKVINTYDNASQAFHHYNDGPDGKANFGGGDDTLKQTFDTTSTPNATYFADVVNYREEPFSQTSTTLFDLIATAKDNTDFNLMAEIQMDGTYITGTYADGLELWMTYIAPNNAQNIGTLRYWVGNDQTTINFTTTRKAIPVNNAVPEPVTLFLFGIGIVGLTASKFRIKKK